MSEYEYELIEELSSGAGYHFQRLHREDGKSFLSCRNLSSSLSLEEKKAALEKILSTMQGFAHLPGFPEYQNISIFNGEPCLVLEDNNLSPVTYLHRKHSLSTKQALELSLSLCQNLIAIHERRLIAHVIHPAYLFCTNQFSRLHIALLPHSLPMACYHLPWQGFPGLKRRYGDLAYISPEMTGLSGHPLDYRSDFFILGILLFEWLSGKHPFRVPGERNFLASLLESEPPRVNQILKDSSQATGDLLVRLLAKAPADRFGNAREVESAIRFCLAQKKQKNNTEDLEFQRYGKPILILDKTDSTSKGIQRKIKTAFQKALHGSSEICLVHGQAGSGKSRLIESLSWMSLKESCLFLQASPSPNPKAQPYDIITNFLNKFSDYLRQLPLEDLQNWQKAFQKAEADWAALCGLAPRLAVLFPDRTKNQDTEWELGPLPKANISYVLLSFFQRLAKKERPLVFCFENLEEADSASLEILEGIFQSPLPHSLGILSWSSEKALPPLLSELLSGIRTQEGLSLQDLEIPSLSQAECKQLVCDAISQNPKDAAALLSFLWNKSKGNPGKLKNTIEALQQEGLLALRERQWHWFLDHFRISLIPEDTEQLWRKRLEQLSEEEQSLLALFSGSSQPLPVSIVQSSEWKTGTEKDSLIGLAKLGFLKLSFLENTFSLQASIHSLGLANAIAARSSFSENNIYQIITKNAFKKDADAIRLLLRWQKTSASPESERLILETKRAVQWGDHDLAGKLFDLLHRYLCRKKLSLNLERKKILLELSILLGRPESIHEEWKDKSLYHLKELIESKITLRKELENADLPSKNPKEIQVLAKKILRKTGIRLNRKFLGIFSPPVQNRLKGILKKHHSALLQQTNELLQSEIQETQKILYYYAKCNSEQRYLVYLKQIELALRYDVWDSPVDVAIASLIAHLSSKQKASAQVATLYKLLAPLELSKEARSILCKYGRIWTDSYPKWRKCLEEVHLQTLSIVRPELAASMEADKIFLDLFYHDIPVSGILKKAEKLAAKSQLGKLEEHRRLAEKYLEFAGVLQKEQEKQPWELLPAYYSYETKFLIHTVHLALALHTAEPHWADLSAEWLYTERRSNTAPVWTLPADFYLGLYWIWNYRTAGKKERVEIRKRLALQLARLKRNAEALPESIHRLHFLEAFLKNPALQSAKAQSPDLDIAIETARKAGLYLEAGLLCRFIGIFYLSENQESMAESYLARAAKDYKKAGAFSIARWIAGKYPEWVPIEKIQTEEENKPKYQELLPASPEASHLEFSISSILSPRDLAQRLAEFLMKISQSKKLVVFLRPQRDKLPEFIYLQDTKERFLDEAAYPERHYPVSVVDSVRRSGLPIAISPEDGAEHLFSADPYLSSRKVGSFYCFAIQDNEEVLAVFYLENPDTKKIKKLPALEKLKTAIQNSLDYEFLKQKLSEQQRRLQNKSALYEQSLAEKRALLDELKEARQKKSVFLTGISERIRKPMDSIERTTARLSSLEQDPNKESLLQKLAKESRELRKVISSILEFSQIEEDAIKPEPSAFDLSECLEDVLSEYTPLAAQKGIEMIYEIAPSVPLRVIGEESQLRQILDKLLRNAIQYTKAGEIHLAVDASQEDILHRINFRLRDTGKGIPPAKAQELFAKHKHATLEESQSGLGLLITQRLCQLMGGDIFVTSEVGKGSIFEFYIKTLGVATPAKKHPYSEILNGKRILLVDDNITVRRILRHHLRIWRTFPMAAISGKAALELFSDPTKRFSAAIIDMEMPQMNGARLIERIQEEARFHNMTFVLLINPLDNPERYTYLNNEKYIVEILKKPVNVFALQGILIESLRKARDRLDRHKQGTVARNLSAKRFD